MTDFERLAASCKKVGLNENGYKAIGRIYKLWPHFQKQPQYVAWLLLRMYTRKFAELKTIIKPWAYLHNMVRNFPVDIAVCQGGDGNPYKEHLPVEYYTNQILGITKYEGPTVRGGNMGPPKKVGDLVSLSEIKVIPRRNQ